MPLHIGVMSDLHLGNRQYGLISREIDFYEQFYKCCSELALCDIVIIAGDIFDKPNPSPESIKAFQKGLNLLNGDVIGIKGNHTMLKRKDHISADEIFENYCLLSRANPEYRGKLIMYSGKNDIHKYSCIDGLVDFCGIDYCGPVDINKFKEQVSELTKILDPRRFNILVVHEAFSEYCGFTGEPLTYDEVDFGKFDLVICGHIHSPYYDDLVQPEFLQPGSIERLNTTEAADEQINGKGVWILEFNNNVKTNTKFVRIESSRKIFLGKWTILQDMKLEDIDFLYENLQKKINTCEKKPIVSIKITCEDSTILKDRDSSLENCLLVNNKYYDSTLDKQISQIQKPDGSMPTIEEVLKEMVKDKYSEEIQNFIVALYNKCKQDTPNISEGIQELADDTFEKIYPVDFTEEDPEEEEFMEQFVEWLMDDSVWD